MPLTIAIDGPVGAGKSSVADQVARRLGLVHLDTGAMYRALGFQAMNRGVDMDSEDALMELLKTTEITVTYEEGVQRTLVNGGDVSSLIRTPEAGMAASRVSRFARVRRHMVSLQQEWCAAHDALLDGRDIGTTVLPNASLKIYLTASAEERARRRFEEYKAKGDPTPYEKVLEDLKKRDEQDMNREVEPLRAAPDAVIVDSTHMNFEETVDHIVKLAQKIREA